MTAESLPLADLNLDLDADALVFEPADARSDPGPSSNIPRAMAGRANPGPRPARSQTSPVQVAAAPAPMPTPTTTSSGPRLGLSDLLRGLGGLVIVAAFLMYLFQGWRDGDALSRGLLLLGHTLALTLAGFASGHWLHEAKGARLFIALALAAVPVSFAYLGGIGYEHLTWDQAHGAAAGFWMATQRPLSATGTMALTAASVPLLAAAVWIGFRVMARRSATALTGLYLLANAALLVPSRDGAAIAALLIGLALLLGHATLALRRADARLATPEGVYARAVLVLPLLVIAGRSLWLHAPDALFFAALALLGYLGLRQLLRALSPDANRRGLVAGAALVLACVTALLAFVVAAEATALPHALELPVAAATLLALTFDLGWIEGKRGGVYRAFGAGALGLSMMLNLAAFDGFASALATLAAGIAVLAYGYGARRQAVFVLGLVAALFGLGVIGHAALADFSIGGWTGLVALGIATIVLGSLLERHGGQLKALAGRWQRHFQARPDAEAALGLR